MVDLFAFLFQIKKRKALASVLLISYNLCLAQENIRFERISVNEGLSQSDVKSIVQDKSGFLWVGTRDGLNRYDGAEFIRYDRRENDSTSLYFNQILDLEVDATGNIWIGATGGVSIYNYKKDSFRNFFPKNSELRDIEINHILLTGEHSALLSTNRGLISFDMKQKLFFTDPQLKFFEGMRVLHAYQNPKYGLWIGTDKGVFVKDGDRHRWTRYLEDNSVHHIAFDPNGKIYLSASSGLFTYDSKNGKIAQVPMPAGVGAVLKVLRTKNGELWVASNKVIVLDKNDVFKYILGHDKFNNYSLSEDRARVIFQTDDEVIWVGTFGYGLNKFNPDVSKFSYLGEQTSVPLSGNYVSTIFTVDDTTVMVGTSRGLDVVSLRTKSAKHFSSDKYLFQILKIRPDRENNIWMTTSNGFMRYSGDKLITKSNTLGFAFDFAEWDDTRLIVASLINGVYLFDRKTDNISLFIPAADLPGELSCLLVEDDHLWIGCKDGLKLYSREGQLLSHFKENVHSAGSLRSSFVKCLYRDNAGDLWIGTWGGGLSKLNQEDSTFTTYNTGDGLPNNVVYGILEDPIGTLWLSTNLGISAFNVSDKSFRTFNFFDGLQSNEFNTGAYFKSPGGKLYFGGINGLSFFDPNEILTRQPATSILKTAIIVNNRALVIPAKDSLRSVQMIHKIETSWNENDIGLEFTTIDFKHAATSEFQYSLKDTTWYDIGNRRSLELIDLPSGQYEIKVRTRQPGDKWGQHQVLLMIDVIPPLWQRTWFRVFAMLVFLTMILAAYRYRVARLRLANSVLSKLVNARTTEIQAKNEEIEAQNEQLSELNNELESFSYSVSHDLRAPLRLVLGYSKMLEEDFYEKLGEEGKKQLNVIQQSAKRMDNLINDLLEFSKTGRKELRKSQIDIGVLLKNILGEINVSIPHKAKVRIDNLPSSILADYKLLSQVWINLVSNAIKYSAKKEAPVVEISSYMEENMIVFCVKDNGAGFDMRYADKLFGVFQRLHRVEEFEGTGVGLALVQRIVAKHGGRVWAEGKVNEGASFYFSLPK